MWRKRILCNIVVALLLNLQLAVGLLTMENHLDYKAKFGRICIDCGCQRVGLRPTQIMRVVPWLMMQRLVGYFVMLMVHGYLGYRGAWAHVMLLWLNFVPSMAFWHMPGGMVSDASWGNQIASMCECIVLQINNTTNYHYSCCDL
ncbi:hypothetical protein V6N12_017898 [Hibiscus sabdariffa]